MKQKQSQRKTASIAATLCSKISEAISPAITKAISAVTKEVSYKDVSDSDDDFAQGSDVSDDDDSDYADLATQRKRKLKHTGRLPIGDSEFLFENFDLFYMNLPDIHTKTMKDLKKFKKQHREWWNTWREKIWRLYFGNNDDNANTRSEILKGQRKLLTKLAMILGLVELVKLFQKQENKDCFFFYRDTLHLDTRNDAGIESLYMNRKAPYKSAYISAMKRSFWDILKKMKTNAKEMNDATLSFEPSFCKTVAKCHARGDLDFDEEWRDESNTTFWSGLLASYPINIKRKRDAGGSISSNKKSKKSTSPSKSAAESPSKSAAESPSKSAAESPSKLPIGHAVDLDPKGMDNESQQSFEHESPPLEHDAEEDSSDSKK